MKRTISILICLLLAFSVYVPAVGEAAAEAVSAVPINNYTVKRTGVIGGTVYPLEGYSLKGEIADRLLPWSVAPDCLSGANNGVLSFNNMAQPLNGSEGIMFYLSIPAENTIAFVLELENPNDPTRWRMNYDPEMSPYVGESVMLLRDGASAWEEKSFVRTLPQSSNLNKNYKCGITFEGAFSGWVKVPYTSLRNDSGLRFDAAKDKLKNIPFRFANLGGDYGAVTVGPLMLVTEDGSAPEISISDTYKTEAAVTAYAPTDYTINSGTLSAAESYLTDKGSAKVAALSGGSASGVRQLCYNLRSEELGHTDGLVIYLDVSAACSFTAHITLNDPGDKSRWKLSYLPQLLLYANNDYYLLSEETGRWQKGTVGLAKDGKSTARGLISIESAFRGWVIIPYGSFANDSGYTFIPEKDTAKDICMTFSALNTSGTASAWMGFKAQAEIDYTSGAATSVEVVERYALTVGNTANGSVTLSRKTAAAGERVVATVVPNSGYRQAADGLKLNYTYAGKAKTKLITEKGDSETAGEGEGNAFYFTMPDSAATVTARLVSTDTLDPILLEPTAVGDSAFRLGLRLYAENADSVTAGFLITDKQTTELSHSSVARGVTELVCSRRYDETSPENGGIKYRDYTVVLDGIINPAKQYTLRGYAAYYENGVKKYRYTDQITVCFNETVTEEMPTLADFGTPTEILKNSAVKYELIDSPFISLSNSSAVKLYTDNGFSCTTAQTNNSTRWLTANYNNFSLDGVTDIVLYIKGPAGYAENLYLNFKSTTGYDYKLWAHRSYYIAALGDKKWTEKKTSEASDTTHGLIDLPAGFEGFIRVPLTSLYEPSKVNGNTAIKAVTFRFSYIGNSANPITVAPVFGAYARSGRDAVRPTVLAELYPETAGAVAYTAQNQVFADSGIFYWPVTENAESYLITAYEKNGGYIERASYRVYSNSGAVTGLEPSTDYTVQITACDRTEAPIAYYKPFTVKTAAANPASAVTKTDVSYTASSGNGNASLALNALPAGSEALLDGNPNRGLRGCMEFYHFTSQDTIKAQLDRYVANNVYTTVSTPIYVCYIYPGDYRGKTLDSTFFSSLQFIFDYCREKKIQLLLRFAYYDVNNFNDRTPTIEEITSHIAQIADNGILTRNTDVLHVLQAGFVGKFGEWHSNTTEVNKKTVLKDFVEKLLPDGIYSQVRMQKYKQDLPSTDYEARFGIHLDSYFGIMDGSELGSATFSYGNAEWDECVEVAALTPNDAELYYWGQFNDMGMYCEGYAAALGAGQLCLTTLSGVNGYKDTTEYSESCMGQWKKLPVTREWLEFNNLPYADGWFADSSGNTVYRTVFEYIRDHLGYKITATELKTEASGNSLSAELKLCNNGFSAAFNLEASLVLLNSSGKAVASTDAVDAASLTTGSHTLNARFTLSGSGEYTLALLLKSKSGAAARLDNKIPFNNGYNILYKFTKG